MLTTDLSLRFDPAYEKISSASWRTRINSRTRSPGRGSSLTHRDMGPRARYLGPEVPAEELIWQDPIPAVNHKLIDEQDIASSRARSWLRGCPYPNWCRPPGRRRPPSVAPTSAAVANAHEFASRRRRIGSQPAGPAGEGAQDPGGIQSAFNSAQSGGKKYRWLT